MTYSEESNAQPSGSIVKYTGSPSEPEHKHEPTRWKRFLNFFRPWTKKTGLAAQYGVELAQAFGEAELAKRQGEAEKLAMEAANIAAEKDLKEQQTVKAVNEEIARIFSQNDQPDISKKMQLANLLAANPQIAGQLTLIENICEELRFKYGTLVEVQPDNTTVQIPIKAVEGLAIVTHGVIEEDPPTQGIPR